MKNPYSRMFRNFSKTSDGAGFCESLHICETRPFKVTVTHEAIFNQQLGGYKDVYEEKVEALKLDYAANVRPSLITSCLILPKSLVHDSTAFIHYQSHARNGKRPTFITSLDLMFKKDASTAVQWDEVMEFVTSGTTFVSEEWTISTGNIESTTVDFGIMGPPDGKAFLRGECDASYNDGEADLSCILWDKNQVIFSEVVKGVKCSSSTVAEILAGILLLIRCIDLQDKLPQLKDLALYTDNKDVIAIVNGGYTITMHNKDRDTFLLLRSLSRHFRNLICVWKPRSTNFMADFLLKEQYFGDAFSKHALEIWGAKIRGAPICRVLQSKDASLIMEGFSEFLISTIILFF